MNKELRILMVDDHPIILEGYQNVILSTQNQNLEYVIDTANNCEMASILLNKTKKNKLEYDVCFFDVSLPPSKNKKITSGEDLALFARRLMPKTKIIILTMFDETYRIQNILNEIKPDGFLIKSDLTSVELVDAFEQILENPPYYSVSVEKVIKNKNSGALYLDEKNRKILYFLSKGYKTSALSDAMSVSTSTIEKRKRHLKEIFKITNNRDETLVDEARKQGYI